MRLAAERPDWIPVVRAALERARANERFGGEFAGSWVVKDLRVNGTLSWIPNLRFLISYGIAEKSGESTRGGQRAYYRLPDPEGIQRALEELDALEHD